VIPSLPIRRRIPAGVLALGLLGCQPSLGVPVHPTEAAALAQQRRIEQSESWFAEGSRFEGSGDSDRAEQYYLAALRAGIAPDRAFPALIGVCVRAERFRTAAHYTEQYLGQSPANHHVRYLAATLRLALGQSNEALEHLQQLLAMNPTFAEAHYLAGVIYLSELSSFERADAHLRTYLKMEPSGKHADQARAYLFIERDSARNEAM
jgi:tetratricopeptide (TPR) repeat protein